MGTVLTNQDVLALAPDPASAKAAGGLVSDSKWVTLGADDGAVTLGQPLDPAPLERHRLLLAAQLVRVAQAGTALSGRYATRASGAVGAMRGAFEDGDLPLGKADQLARFHAQVAPVAEEGLLEEDLGALVAAAKDDVVATGPQGRRRERVRGLSEKELAAAITRTGRLLKPEKDIEDEDELAAVSESTLGAGARVSIPAGIVRLGSHPGTRGRDARAEADLVALGYLEEVA